VTAPVDQPVHRLRLAFEDRLDTTVPGVADPTADPCTDRLLGAGVAEEHTMHPAAHEHATANGHPYRSAVTCSSSPANFASAAFRRVGTCSVGTSTGL
jgi:hypothetical protein